MSKVFHSMVAFLISMTPILTFSPNIARGESVEAIAKNVQKAYDETRDIRADFTQETKIQGFETTTRAAGTLFIKKPGKARWDYASPSEQHVYVNGETVLIYTPELKQALKSRLQSELDTQTPIFLLAGAGRLTELFSVAANPNVRDGDPPSLVLKPKDGRGPKRIVITLDPARYLITKVRLEDPNGNISTLAFSDIRQNTGLGDRFFTFIPPKGVEIVEPFPAARPGNTKP